MNDQEKLDWQAGFYDGRTTGIAKNHLPAYQHGFEYGLKVRLYQHDQENAGMRAFKELTQV